MSVNTDSHSPIKFIDNR